MAISRTKQCKIYAKTKNIRNVLADILILQKTCLIGQITVPHVKSQINHLKRVENITFDTYIKEINKLDVLYKKLLKIKEKMLSYYD